MPKTLKEQIKKLCDKFDKSLEPWEEFFPREILSLLKEEKKKWAREIEGMKKSTKMGYDSLGNGVYNIALDDVLKKLKE